MRVRATGSRRRTRKCRAKRVYSLRADTSTVPGLITVRSSNHIVGWTRHHARGALMLLINQSTVLEHILYYNVIVLGRDGLIIMRPVGSSDVHVVHVHRVSYFSH